ncbi:hypothetical protein FJTKL_06755 [Diaporthe vaccinii]|uniref:Deacetylase sirtuin-type domain-containing protein n=1 Tax=Diaporthe vaccinii TaxID=105482 RepID=A0ABR4DQR9_9PEZI
MKGPRPSCVSTGPLETPDDLTSDDLEISNDVAPARKMHKVADLAVPSSDQGKGLRDALDGKKKIVVVAGAGISVSAGVPDFRSKNGLFSGNGELPSDDHKLVEYNQTCKETNHYVPQYASNMGSKRSPEAAVYAEY